MRLMFIAVGLFAAACLRTAPQVSTPHAVLPVPPRPTLWTDVTCLAAGGRFDPGASACLCDLGWGERAFARGDQCADHVVTFEVALRRIAGLAGVSLSPDTEAPRLPGCAGADFIALANVADGLPCAYQGRCFVFSDEPSEPVSCAALAESDRFAAYRELAAHSKTPSCASRETRRIETSKGARIICRMEYTDPKMLCHYRVGDAITGPVSCVDGESLPVDVFAF